MSGTKSAYRDHKSDVGVMAYSNSVKELACIPDFSGGVPGEAERQLHALCGEPLFLYYRAANLRALLHVWGSQESGHGP